MKILSGDIGGTHSRLACYQQQGTELRCLVDTTYPSSLAADLGGILRHFLEQHALRPDAAGLGLAGPVRGRVCRTTNLPWVVDADELQQQLSIPRVILLNDLEATAWGIGALASEDLLTLQAGDPQAEGNRAIIAPGTGLGEAGLYWDGQRHHPFATEGGHGGFAPASELEFGLLEFLQQDYSHVSWERLVSGPGLVHIHRFLLSRQPAGTPQDDPREIAAQAPNDPLCHQAMELFFHLLAAEAGNLALKIMARGGLYIGGGIAPQNLPWLQRAEFIRHFLHKGRMTPLLQAMPLHVILNDRIALMGPVTCLSAEWS